MSPGAESRVRAAVIELAEAIVAALEAEPAPDRLLGIEEAGGLLGLGRSLVYAELQGGRLRSVKIGRRRLIPASAVATYIAERQTP